MYKFCVLWPRTFFKREEKTVDISEWAHCFSCASFHLILAQTTYPFFIFLDDTLSMLPAHVLRPGWSLACKTLTPNVHLASLRILFSNCLSSTLPATPYRLSRIILFLRLYPHLTWYRHNYHHVFHTLLYLLLLSHFSRVQLCATP